jgi:hypothetical protein
MLRLRRWSIEVHEAFGEACRWKKQRPMFKRGDGSDSQTNVFLMLMFLVGKASLPLPPGSILGVFYQDSSISELFADCIGTGEVAGFLGGIAFFDQLINFCVRDSIRGNL